MGDCGEALPLLERNRAMLAADGVAVEVAQLDWGSTADHASVLAGGEPFDVVVASDVVVAGFDTDRLLASCVALLARKVDARVLIGFEFREEWEAIGTFIGGAFEAGLECSHEPLG